MDPTQTILDMFYFLSQGEDDRQNVADCLRDLHGWVSMGGALPDPKVIATRYLDSLYDEEEAEGEDA